jgi:hypothetical protein
MRPFAKHDSARRGYCPSTARVRGVEYEKQRNNSSRFLSVLTVSVRRSINFRCVRLARTSLCKSKPFVMWKRIARSSRSASSLKRSLALPTQRRTLQRRSPRPSNGSMYSPVASSRAIALTVKSRRARSSSRALQCQGADRPCTARLCGTARSRLAARLSTWPARSRIAAAPRISCREPRSTEPLSRSSALPRRSRCPWISHPAVRPGRRHQRGSA